MARLYAQLCSIVFAIVGIGGLFLGTAGPVVNGQAQGNLGGITLHLTYPRDVANLILLLMFVFVGFFAGRRSSKFVMFGVGVVLFGLGVIGFIIGDNDAANKGLIGFNFPLAINLFDMTVGVLALLAALGTLGDDEIQQSEQRSFLREG